MNNYQNSIDNKMNSKLKELNKIINCGKVNQMKIENMIESGSSKMNSSVSSLRKDQSEKKYGFNTNKRLQSAKTYLKEGNNSNPDVKLNYMINIENINQMFQKMEKNKHEGNKQPKQNNFMINRVSSNNDLNISMNKVQKQDCRVINNNIYENKNQNSKVNSAYSKGVFSKTQLLKKQKKNNSNQVNRSQQLRDQLESSNDRNQQLQKIFLNKKLLKDLIFSNQSKNKMGESEKNIINMVDTSENINININSSNNSGYKCKHKGIKQLINVLKSNRDIVKNGGKDRMVEQLGLLKDRLSEMQEVDKYSKVVRDCLDEILVDVIDVCKTSIVQQKEQVDKYDQQIDKYKQQIDRSDKQVDNYKQQIVGFEQLMAQNKQKINELENQLIIQSNQYDKLDLECKEEKQKLEKVENKLEIQKNKNAEIQEIIQSKNDDYEQLLQMYQQKEEMNDNEQRLQELNNYIGEIEELNQKVEKQKEREKKLMKLLSAIMEKGIDIEQIYIQEVMSKKKSEDDQKYLIEKVEEIPEEEDIETDRKSVKNKELLEIQENLMDDDDKEGLFRHSK